MCPTQSCLFYLFIYLFIAARVPESLAKGEWKTNFGILVTVIRYVPHFNLDTPLRVFLRRQDRGQLEGAHTVNTSNRYNIYRRSWVLIACDKGTYHRGPTNLLWFGVRSVLPVSEKSCIDSFWDHSVFSIQALLYWLVKEQFEVKRQFQYCI